MLYIVMEYVPGPNLSRVLASERRLSAAVTLALLHDVAGALDELHRNSIIHRDLKPANIILDLEGRGLVTDFGLAIRRPADAVGPAAAPLAGTPPYMAPELFDGHASPLADVYALGILAFELLCGRRPFDGDLHTLREAHARAPLPSQRLRAAGVPDAAIGVIERAARKKPQDRYASAGEFVRALGSMRGTALSSIPRQVISSIARRTPEDEPRAGLTSGASESQPTPAGFAVEGVAPAWSDRPAAAPRINAPVSFDPPPLRRASALAPESLGPDIACERCGRRLIDCPRDGACRGCGHPVARSVYAAGRPPAHEIDDVKNRAIIMAFVVVAVLCSAFILLAALSKVFWAR